ncbi:hypothetical protein V6Z11_A01G203000 [Gossypium hirsutum]
MAKIKDESNLQVTFSKRRSGLFKKASELCTLCGVEIAIIVFSPGNKVFSFGHPDVENILNRYVHNTKDTSPTWQLIEAHRNAIILRLNAQLTEMMSQIEAQKKRGEELDKMRKASQEQNWWESPIEELSLPQLQFLRSAMAELKKIVQREAEQLIIQNTNCQQLFPGSSSQGTPNYETMNNNMAFNANMMGGEYIDPNMIAPTPNYNPNPPAEGHINPNPEGSDILAPTSPTSPGFGRGLF